MKIYDEIINLNNIFIKNENNGDLIDNSNFIVKKGKFPVIISAPHSVKSFRNGKIKSADMMTGGIACYLANYLDCYLITRVCNLNDDPNAYNDGESLKYKKIILDIIKKNKIVILFDIHGCSDDHDFDIELGTNNGININYNDEALDILFNNLSSLGCVVKDVKFKASSSTTVSNFIHNKSLIPCIQIEISNELRTNPDKLEVLLSMLLKSMNDIFSYYDNLKEKNYEI